jgi:hypothetical protein
MQPRQIELMPPQIDGQRVTFRWRVDPESALYRRTEFTLGFPGDIDLSRVPKRLWWDLAFICLHPQWLLLRPCRIRIPLRLSAGERQFWLQLLRNGWDTLAAMGPAEHRGEPLGIRIISGDQDLPRTPVSGSRFGSSFSGGKDSLLQAGLLCELTQRPLLVATTSPLPPLEDHDTARRRHVFESIQQRRDIQFVEVASDFRGLWDNGFAASRGHPIGVNELTDTFLYTASLLAVGAAVGASRLFVASEAEVQDNRVVENRIVQHNHFMYSAATHRALDRLLTPYGIRLSSTTWPLYSMQVQQLLWTRYPDLCDLQYSCWRVPKGQETCSQCEQCLRIAMTALSDGENPERMGIDLPRLLAFAPTFEPLADPPAPSPGVTGAGARAASTSRRLSHMMDSVRRVSLPHLARCLARRSIRRLISRETINLLQDFRRIRKRASRFQRPAALGAREAFFAWLDPDLRERLIAIYTKRFPTEPHEFHVGILERSQALTRRATSMLGA